jgi:threonylcarbamoyladenosine tRNA methylthiotransferase MtaB
VKYSILTFGCRVNQADSMAIERDLRARGGIAVSSADADVIVVNSCSVTATADQGTRQAIRRAARDNPRARIVVTGCYATRRPDEIAALPGVTAVVPNAEKERVGTVPNFLRFLGTVPNVRLLGTVPNLDPHLGTVPNDDPRVGTVPKPDLEFLLDRTAFTLRVQTGCEEQCSFCIIPTTRGRSVSRPIDEIVRELQRAEQCGFREVTLTGVHLGAYGQDLAPRATLGAMLEAAIGVTDAVLLRLGSLEPMDVPETLADLTDTGRLAPAFHLPLQHASDAMLARMRRPYVLDDYRRIVDRLRDRLPHAALGSDIIVGFPGETGEDFDRLCRYLESSPLSSLHVFPYSDRPGTEASSFTDKIPAPVIKERGRIVRDIGHRLAARFRLEQAGTRRPALTIEDGTIAVTDNGFRLPVAGHRRNERIEVHIPA